MKYLLILITSLVSLSALSADVVEYIVRHQNISDHLIGTDKHSLEEIFIENKNLGIEKINVETYSLDFAKDILNELLSLERMEAVNSYLLKFVEDPTLIETVNLNAVNAVVDDHVSHTAVRIYFFDKGNETPIPGIEKVLFPEEFETEQNSYIPEDFETNTKFKIENIHFHGNSAMIKEDSEESLETLSRFMLSNPSLEILIEGHVNGKLSKSYLKEAGKSNPEKKVYNSSQHLSLARAETVKQFLVDQGIDESRISVEGKGANEMLFKKPRNKKEQEANRRIEVIIVKD